MGHRSVPGWRPPRPSTPRPSTSRRAPHLPGPAGPSPARTPSGIGSPRPTPGSSDWRAWGPYLSERAWGTVREDYSEHGTAWDYFPHDHARSRAYRWNEDGMAGVCDDRQTFCFALALWNGADPILKERMFGLGGDGGNHGEDVKEYWWYQDSTPDPLVDALALPLSRRPPSRTPNSSRSTRRRGRDDPEYELVDTGVFDEDRYWAVTVDYAKAAPTDMCMRITVANRGDRAGHACTCCPRSGSATPGRGGCPARDRVPAITADGARLVGAHRTARPARARPATAPRRRWSATTRPTPQRLWGLPGRQPVPEGRHQRPRRRRRRDRQPGRRGHQGRAALRRSTCRPAARREIRLRLTGADPAATVPPADLGAGFEAVLARRQAEADEFFADADPGRRDAPTRRWWPGRRVAGLMWGKQFYHFDVARWLAGDPARSPPPAGRRHGRNSAWPHMNSCDVISMPDPWEYPWYAAWDLAFHCVAIARVDPGFAKDQLLLLLREWYMHPNGQIPAYEWAFGDVNPPVHAWAALQVFEIDGGRDHDFLARVMHKLLLNFTWWVNRKDTGGNNVFEGGFLGLDNIGPFDRSAALPVAGVLEQSDGTGWMAMYALNLLEMAIVLAEHDHTYEDLATKFFEHFAYIAAAAYSAGALGRRGRLLLRRAAAARRHADAAAGALGRRAAAAGRDDPAHLPRPCTGCPSSPPGCAGS